MRKSIIAYLFLLAATWFVPNASAQVDEFISTIDHRFGQSIIFQAEIQADLPVAAGVLYFQVEGDSRTNMGLAKIVEMGNNRYQAFYEHQISDYSIPPFSEIITHWEIFLLNGDVYKSAAIGYPYIDNRFEWDTIEENNVQIHWYSKDRLLGEMIHEIVVDGESAIQELLPGARLNRFEVYIYADDQDLPAASRAGRVDPTAGNANLESGIVLISLPATPEQQSLAAEYIPHELMRIQLHQFTSGGENNLPAWLREGLASAVELNSNPDVTAVFEKASNTGELIPIHSLCSSFPTSSDEAALSRAESRSFVRYLHSAYGSTGIKNLIQGYSKPQDCEIGFKVSMGISLSQAEQDWKKGLGPKQAQKSIEGFIPWMILSLAVLTAPIVVFIRTVFRKKSADR